MTEDRTADDRSRDAVVRRHLRELYDRHAGAWDDGVVRFYPPEAESRRHLSALALEDNGRDRTPRRVGVEPSGEAYNSITFDAVNNRPHNPMKNAGALVATNLVRGRDVEEKVRRLLERLRVFAANPE
jgi:glutaminase